MCVQAINANTTGLDLEGGWYDAGDHLKLTLPFASSVWRLAWSLHSYQDAAIGTTYENSTNFLNGLRQLKWATDYLIKLHPGTENSELLVAMVRTPADNRHSRCRVRHRQQPAGALSGSGAKPK